MRPNFLRERLAQVTQDSIAMRENGIYVFPNIEHIRFLEREKALEAEVEVAKLVAQNPDLLKKLTAFNTAKTQYENRRLLAGYQP